MVRKGIVIAGLILGLGLGPSLAQHLAQTCGDPPALDSIRMIDTLTGWATTPGGCGAYGNPLLRTTDGGTHWRDVTPRDSAGRRIGVYRSTAVSSLIAWMLPSGIGFTGSGDFTNQVLHTTNGGRTWRHGTIPAGRVWAIHFVDRWNGWAIANLPPPPGVPHIDPPPVWQDVVIYRSTDGGDTWIRVAAAGDAISELSDFGAKDTIIFLNATIGWIMGGQGYPDVMTVYVTHDSGHSWHPQVLPPPPQLRPPRGTYPGYTEEPTVFPPNDGIFPIHYGLNDPQNRQKSGGIVVLHVTHDGGMTWATRTPVPITHRHSFSSSFSDVDHGWVTDGRVLYATSDGGRRWTKIEPGPPFDGLRRVDFVSPHVGWGVRDTSPFLLKTVDGGRTWAPVRYSVVR